MRDTRRLRRLVGPDGVLYRWRVRHRHTAGSDCREVLTLYRDGVPLRIVFRAGPGRVAGGGYPGHTGLVFDASDHQANLYEPGVVRAFLDEALRRGVPAGRAAELDGWELLPAVAVSRAAGATPGAPPDCPPGP
ncbi:hypothetical protein [Streptomyces sp. NPDC005573]|uniref:hypothetical protein n=1 Tax=unclassified Streptomyces TaxID=2593676 RepID=UPI0033AB75EB